MMNPAYNDEAQRHLWKSEVKVLGSDAQVWRQDPQVSARVKGI